MKNHKIYSMSFAKVYPCYTDKAEKKGYTKQQVNQIIEWLTGYDEKSLKSVLEDERDFKAFFEKAPALNPARKLITGVVCGIRVENIDEPLMQEIRYLDKLVDELVRGNKMKSILKKND